MPELPGSISDVENVTQADIDQLRSPTSSPSTETQASANSSSQNQTERPKPEVAKRGDFIESGKPREEIKLKPEAKQAIIDRLIKRASVAKDLRDREKPLSVVDQMVLREGFLDRLNGGDITTDDITLGWYLINDEIISTEIATSYLVRAEPSRFKRLANVPVIGRFAQDPRVGTAELRFPGTGQSISEYATETGINTWGEARIEKRLRDLGSLKIQIEKSFYKNGVRNPIVDRLTEKFRGTLHHEPVWGEVDDPLSPYYETSKTGHKLKDEMVVQANAIVEEGIRTGKYRADATLDTLIAQDPVLGLTIYHEASQRALAQKAKDYALEIVKSGKHEADTEAIRQRATELRQPPRPEEAAPLEEANAAAQTALTEAETKYTSLKNSLDGAIQAVRSAGANKDKATGKYNGLEARLSPQIQSLQNQLDQLYARLGQAQPQQQAQQGARARRNTGNTADSALGTAIKDLQDRIAANERELTEARNIRIDAEIDERSATNHLDRLRGAEIDQGPPPVYEGGEIRQAEEARNTARTRAVEAKQALEAKQREIAAGGSPERAQKAKALDRHALIAENRARIQEELYSQQHGTEFTTDKLSDSDLTSDGQVAGLEAFRRLIVQTVDKKGFDAEMVKISRGMIPNEGFARAVIEYFQIDGSLTRISNGNVISLEQEFTNLNEAKSRFASSNDPAEKQTLERYITEAQTNLARDMVAWLGNCQRMEIASFVNFIIDRGLVQAEMGNPSLTMVK